MLDPRFAEHVAVAALNFNDIEFSDYQAAPAELRV
jgi:hypothetical protein